jgi:tetratricopeptide (TPR) repeat protein
MVFPQVKIRIHRFGFTKISLFLVYSFIWSGAALADPNEDLAAGLAAGKKGYYSEAIGLFSSGIKSGTIQRESLASALNNRGVAYRRKGFFAQAIRDYNRAIRLNPEFATAYSNLGLAYAKQSRYDLAIATFNQAIRIDPHDADTYLKRGNAYYDKGMFEQAVSDYSRAIELKPDFLIAYYNRSDAYQRKGLPRKALMDYLKVLDLNPDFDCLKEAFEQ